MSKDPVRSVRPMSNVGKKVNSDDSYVQNHVDETAAKVTSDRQLKMEVEEVEKILVEEARPLGRVEKTTF